jgi:hypothetical protein
MGDYALLYLVDSSEPIFDELPDGAACLMLNRHLPIVWLALFDRGDITDAEMEDLDALWPYLTTRLQPALNRLAARRPYLRAAFPGLKEDWIDAFAAYLTECGQAHIHLDAAQIGGLVTNDGAVWRAEIDKMLSQFDTVGTEEPALGRQVYHARFGGGDPAKLVQCWWYCGGGGTDSFDPDD